MRCSGILLALTSISFGSQVQGLFQQDSINTQAPLHDGSKLSEPRPNIIFILTDDQDLHLNSLAYLPHVSKHLIEQGTLFERHHCTVALCCPSRVNIWTGRAAHNTNVTDVSPPYGGYPKFVEQGFNEAWLPLWLQRAGYNTYYTGKLFNSHSVRNYNSPFPSGFNGSDFLLDPYTYEYLNATFQHNEDEPVSHEGEYSTDVLAAKAYHFLDDALADDSRPFFLTAAPIAPHSNFQFQEDPLTGHIVPGSIITTAPVPATRHQHLFPDAIVPRSPSFNPKEVTSPPSIQDCTNCRYQPHGVSWIRSLPRQTLSNVEYNDHFYRQRLRSLQAVDEIVDGIVTRLRDHNALDNTWIFFSSDNGYHVGQHRLQPGKGCSYKEDVNVPLIVRGPGVPKGAVSRVVTSHTDLAPTFFKLAGVELRPDFDGQPIPLTQTEFEDVKSQERDERVNVEYWGWAIGEGEFGGGHYENNTYKALRLIGSGYNFYYTVWCNGDHELYDLLNDPDETHNLYLANHTAAFEFPNLVDEPISLKHHAPTTLSHLLSRLDALVLVLKTCKARTCTHPWEVLHPSGDVGNLHAALRRDFDDFYEVQQNKVKFDRCEKGYILGSEGPLEVKAYGSGQQIWPRGGSRWSEFV